MSVIGFRIHIEQLVMTLRHAGHLCVLAFGSFIRFEFMHFSGECTRAAQKWTRGGQVLEREMTNYADQHYARAQRRIDMADRGDRAVIY